MQDLAPSFSQGSRHAPRTDDGSGCAAQSPAARVEPEHIPTTPPLKRTSIAPSSWPQSLLRRVLRVRRVRNVDAEAGPPAQDARLHRDGAVRRLSLLMLTIGQTWIATDFMTTVLPYQGRQPLEIAILVLFAILFGWVSAGFWTALAGFFLLLTGRDRYAISARSRPHKPIDPSARTAVIMPICNEDVARVFAGLRATYESLERSGQSRHFDFFVLSDSADADKRVAEQAAWLDLCRVVNGFGRIFYRWRRHRIKRKSGNVADFCRRWGSNYRYMVVLDADSVMTGECLTRLVGMMEATPGAGIIQTIPRAAGRDTLHARIQQFAANVYGPLFAAGLHFWQLGESHYWGHNAIIRVTPFMRYCALRRLPGRGVLSGEILSHDFVEAALMRRAGWGVWIAYDLPGSYEEMPPNLMDEIKRDRRWCQGNLMNFRLIAMDGVHTVHRAVFMTGVLAYVSSPLWFTALILSTVLLAVHTLYEPVYFLQPYQLFPLWPEWRPERAVALFSTTLSLLFLPKILSMLIVAKNGARAFGGALRLTASVLFEMIVSALLAPIRMIFHTQFVTAALAGRSVQWKSPPREDVETTWTEALHRHGGQTLLGMLWVGGVYGLNPAHVWWLLPVGGALALSIPVSVILSRASLGRRLRARGLFLIPEEASGSTEIRRTAELTRAAVQAIDFVAVIVDPVANARASAMAPHGHRGGHVRASAEALLQRALAQGPQALSARDKMTLLEDSRLLRALHEQVTSSEPAVGAWRQAGGLPACTASPQQRVVTDTSGQPFAGAV
ncbi:MAG: glucans biosynthesis glucosyltransferase MdoH [Burkholderiales bacterium]|nr:glucans biosynthesis glucosyltransferase MdoH [Burkholderiales bacterium]